VTDTIEAKAKERLHRLVDQIPEGEVHTAERFLEYLTTADDPVLRALMNAPEGDEPITDDERPAIQEGLEALEAGDVYTLGEVEEELGL
jgi:alkylated DNA nucleotide flippase Atl1